MVQLVSNSVETQGKRKMGETKEGGEEMLKKDIQKEGVLTSLVEWCYEKTDMDREWRRLQNSPADHNEYYKLKLPRAWEPLDNSGTSPDAEGSTRL